MRSSSTNASHATSESARYFRPTIVGLGSIVAMTGHCTSGCGHDSVDHPNEYKKAADLE